MNIEIADRLCELRKSRKLSQEQLAEKLGVSRQAVSKWERGEASPDTENLIGLAEVYDVSIDEILTGKSRATKSNESDDSGGDTFIGDSTTSDNNNDATNTAYESNINDEDYTDDFGYRKSKVSFKNGINVNNNGEYVHVGFDGIHVVEKGGTQVHIDSGGINVKENGEQKVYTDEDGNVLYKGYKEEPMIWGVIKNVCIPIIAIIAFLIWGFCFKGWYIAWLVFLAIPVITSFIDAIVRRKPNHFCYPVLVVIAYLVSGLKFGVWHPTWVVFLTIPIFYGICEALKKCKR